MNLRLLVLETTALPTELFSFLMLNYLFELYNKLILLFVTLCSTFLVCYWYKDVLLFLITQMHLHDENVYFIFTDVTELFSVYIKVVFFVTIQVTVWCFFYHLLFFVSIALYPCEFKFFSSLWFYGTFFWFLASFLSSYVMIPFGWSFFLSFQLSGFYFEARINEYLSFYFNTYGLCLIYCQLFTILFFFITDIKHDSNYIKKYRKLYYYMFLIFATCVTPPDLISQIWTTFFLATVYEIVLFSLIFSIYSK